MEHFRKEIGENIYRARKSAKLNQIQLAEKIGVSQTRISQLENGETDCTFEEANGIAIACSTTADLISPHVFRTNISNVLNNASYSTFSGNITITIPLPKDADVQTIANMITAAHTKRE